ncbi:MAG: hypothetical protein ABI881_07920 [Betaproteobacteria bacterium]
MNLDDIYSKTERGLEELRTRQMNLPVQLRSVLIMIDGQHTVAQTLARAQALSVGPDVFEQLAKLALIERRFGARSDAESGVAAERSQDDVQRFLGLQKSINAAISEHLGIRGYGMMLRLQRAGNLRDLHDLLPDLAQALVKRIGINAATPIVEGFEQMLVRTR